jgi:hypothetical protein
MRFGTGLSGPQKREWSNLLVLRPANTAAFPPCCSDDLRGLWAPPNSMLSFG